MVSVVLYYRSVTLVETLSTLCSVLIESHTVYYEWLLVVPLLHILKDQIKPFTPVKADHKMDNDVITAGLDLTKFRATPRLDLWNCYYTWPHLAMTQLCM